MSITIEPPYKIFTDLESNPLDNGYIYIGTSGLNPETNPIAVYWDSAMTIAASQPLRTISGFIVRNGSPANVYVAGDYSITVKTSASVLIYSTLSWTLANDISSAIHTAPNKATPVDADEFGLWDSVTGLLNHVTWANIKATLVTYLSALTSTWAISTTGTAATSTNITVVDAAADTTTWPLLAGSITGVQPPLTDTSLTYDASTNTLASPTFSGSLSGSVTRASAAGVGVASSSTTVEAITGTTTSAANGAIKGTATAAGGNGVNGENTSLAGGYGVYGTSAANGVTVGYGVYGNHSGSSVLSAAVLGISISGNGGYFVSTNNIGLIAQSDVTTPAKAAFKIVPQDAQPTGDNGVGDMYVTTAGVLKICTVAGSPGTWVSVGTQV